MLAKNALGACHVVLDIVVPKLLKSPRKYETASRKQNEMQIVVIIMPTFLIV